MKKNSTTKVLKFIPIIFAFCLFCHSHAWATANNIKLTTQSEVDNFVATYSSTCTSVTGYLEIGKIIGSASNITDISGLSFLTSISGDLRMFPSPNLPDMDGLENIAIITGNLTFSGRFTNLEGWKV